jgi:Protein of unknown function (DUF3126)
VNDSRWLTLSEAISRRSRRNFDKKNIRVVVWPKKTNSLEIYFGEVFLGALFLETEKGHKSYNFELPILDVDLAD